MIHAASKERVATLPVGRGLFVLRYASSGSADAPRVFVRPSPSSEKSLQIISAPGQDEGVLSKPGASAVVVANDVASLHVTVSASSPDGDLDANVQLETIALSEELPRARCAASAEVFSASSPEAKKAAGVAASEFAFSAHIARRGDIVVKSGEWAAGPMSPSQLEGVQLDWTPPPGVALEYQVLVAGANGRWSAWVSTGAFAGSRGQRRPLVGLRLRLVGKTREVFSLVGDALFLGSPIVSQAGNELEFVSRSGADPLVGLRLQLNEDGSEAESMDGKKQFGGGTRVRVFRSSRAGVPGQLPHRSGELSA